ncbi:MAG: hypothetical protein RIT22_659 [Bacteroidota bacterium]|jgi:hypothetical protein
MKKIFSKILSITALSVVIASCSSDSLEPSLVQSRDFTLNPPSTVQDLNLLANGMYKRMVAVPYYGRDLIIYNEVRTDNAYSNNASGRFLNVGTGTLTAAAAYPIDTWTQIYRVIANANLIINSTIDGSAANDLKAQALVARALAHFDLLKLYGQHHVAGQGGMDALGVPYVKTYRDLSQLAPARNKVSEVKQFIYDDLNAALPLFGSALDYTKINKQSAYAIKSRVGIYFGDWSVAKDAAATALGLGTATIVPQSGFVSSFAADGKQVNSVFELVQLSNDNNGINGLYQIYGATNYGDVVINTTQNFQSIFESTDVRKSAFMISTIAGYERNIGKYTKLATNTKVIRYEEIVLNYAEALLETGDATGALTQLNRIPAQRGATAYTTATKANVLLERRKELAFEGFRFDDRVRNGLGTPTSPKATTAFAYGDYRLAFPIPQSEINGNSVMKQNYNY